MTPSFRWLCKGGVSIVIFYGLPDEETLQMCRRIRRGRTAQADSQDEQERDIEDLQDRWQY